ncbi:MAG: amidase [Gammaproteobacteria bacterium]|nr:amidase [Gammaproteobacteria bacterium]NIV49713.1 amidase [Gammaproteobacteria bacterium]NIW57111.1 amidase [Gammaproteobacteria bacterium]
MTKPCDLSAVEARRLIGTRELSPVELLESCIERIEAVNPTVNAIVATAYDRARKEAKEAEHAVLQGEPLGPLHGLPMGVKDLNLTENVRTTFGSLIHEDFVPEHDERMVADLRAAGAILVGKTNTPEFGAGANTVNKVYGATLNPFDTARTCGGSSGGSAVALATGMLPLCTGSDTGGSLRIPAGFCGITAIRCTPGMVPSERRVVGLSTFSVQGPMARSVTDAALMLGVMANYDPRDPLSHPYNADSLETLDPVDLSTLRVAISPDLGFATVDDGIRETFAACMEEFRPAFGECIECSPEMENASRAFWLIRGVYYLAGRLQAYREHKHLLGPNVLGNVEAGLAMKSEDIGWAMAEETRIYRALQSFFDDIDVLICPTVAVPPFPVEQLYCTHINGVELDNYIQWADLTSGLTLTGHPIVSIPCGLDPTGTPFGVQIIGPRRYSERFTIAVAAAMERYAEGRPRISRPVPDIDSLTA